MNEKLPNNDNMNEKLPNNNIMTLTQETDDECYDREKKERREILTPLTVGKRVRVLSVTTNISGDTAFNGNYLSSGKILYHRKLGDRNMYEVVLDKKSPSDITKEARVTVTGHQIELLNE